MARSAREHRLARHRRVRKKVSGTGSRPRLAVFRSLNHIYAQVVRDDIGQTVAAASSLELQRAGTLATGTKTEDARQVGSLLAERSRARGIASVAFDRGGYRYHGRVKALAEAARSAGLEF